MRNAVVAFAFTATLALVGTVAWKAEAVPLLSTPMQVTKPIQSIACNGRAEACPPGRHEVCGPQGHCWCAPC